MDRITRFKLLQVFGDGREHNWFEVIFLGVNFLKVNQKTFERYLSMAIDYGLLQMVETPEIKFLRSRESYQISKHDYMYKITPSGDTCLRNEQIERHGDPDYYRNFDRSLGNEKGLGKYAPIPRGLTKERRHAR